MPTSGKVFVPTEYSLLSYIVFGLQGFRGDEKHEEGYAELDLVTEMLPITAPPRVR